MDPRVLSAAVTGVSSLLGGALGIQASRDAEERAYARNLSLMRQQNAFNVNMWQRSNEYNSPTHQMQLLKEAGINPAVYDANGNFQPASEVTSAAGDVPYNSQIGQQYANLDPSSKVLQALQTDVAIQKARTDIQYQKMLNEDYKLRLDAAKEGLVDPNGLDEFSSDFSGDFENGYVMDVTPQKTYNQYQERRRAERLAQIRQNIENRLSESEREVYDAGKEFLKDMPREQLNSLRQEIRERLLNNTLLDMDVKMMKEYGISPHDADGWQSFLKAVLRNPDAVGNVFDAVSGAVPSVIESNYAPVQKMFNFRKGYGNSHRNPRR